MPFKNQRKLFLLPNYDLHGFDLSCNNYFEISSNIKGQRSYVFIEREGGLKMWRKTKLVHRAHLTSDKTKA
jgi:hypothetical protein